MKDRNWGGRREGAGAPAKDEWYVDVHVRLSPEDARRVQAALLPGEKMGAGVRRLALGAVNLRAQTSPHDTDPAG